MKSKLSSSRGALQARPFLLITGMHRGGTSFLARALNLMGVYLGELESLTSHEWRYDSDNLRGHWESKKFLDLGEKTLELNKSSWHEPPISTSIDATLGSEIRSAVSELTNHPSLAFGYKDPRILLYLDSWAEYLPQNTLVVGIFRNPIKVAESLKSRNQFSYEKSITLWKTYNEKLLSALELYDGFLLDFDWPRERLLSEVREIARKLGLNDQSDISKWYTEDLLHSDKTMRSDYKLSEETVSLYAELKKRSEENKTVAMTAPQLADNEYRRIIHGLLSEIQNQGLYFKVINEEKLVEIRKLQKEIAVSTTDLQRTIKDVEILQTVNVTHQKTEKLYEEKIDKLQEEINGLKEQLAMLSSQKESVVQSLNQSIQRLEAEHQKGITIRDQQIANLQGTINAIYNSKTWRLLKRYDQVMGRDKSSVVKGDIANGNNRTVSELIPSSYSPLTSGISTAKEPASTVPSEHLAPSTNMQTTIPKRLQDKKDIVCFPIIDWNFRYQRTQHLLSQFAKNGHRIFYLKVTLAPQNVAYKITGISDNIFEVSLNCIKSINIYKDLLKRETLESTLSSLERMKQDLDIDGISLPVFPTWAPVVFAMKQKYGWPIVYDCLDDYHSFGNIHDERLNEESELFGSSDLVVTSSSHLYKKARTRTDKVLFLPNAGEFEHFKYLPQNTLLHNIQRPIAGYYGAIADWFDDELIEFAATKRPSVNFVLIGHTFGANITRLKKLPNVHFLGEKPYQELPDYLYHFDVCLIPFKLTPLIQATHPVKFYEYLAAGKPVITTKIPELIPFANLCYISSDRNEFLGNLDLALVENDPEIKKMRTEFSSKNTWHDRFASLYSELDKINLLKASV